MHPPLIPFILNMAFASLMRIAARLFGETKDDQECASEGGGCGGLSDASTATTVTSAGAGDNLLVAVLDEWLESASAADSLLWIKLGVDPCCDAEPATPSTSASSTTG